MVKTLFGEQESLWSEKIYLLEPIVSQTWEREFVLVDTAPNYQTGLAREELKRCLSRALQENIISSPKEIKISTKVGYIPIHIKDFLHKKKFIDDSEYRLNHYHVEIIQ